MDSLFQFISSYLPDNDAGFKFLQRRKSRIIIINHDYTMCTHTHTHMNIYIYIYIYLSVVGISKYSMQNNPCIFSLK